MNKQKRMISLCMVMTLLITMMLPQSVSAFQQKYDYKVINLTPGKYVNAASYTSIYDEDKDISTDTFNMYKLTLKSNGFIVITCADASNSLSLYKTFKKGKDIDESTSIMDYAGQKKYYQVLSKGTYYIHVENKCKFKYTFFGVNSKNNYSRASAFNLTSGKADTVIYPYGWENSRFYRLSLKQKRSITVSLLRRDGNSLKFTILNSIGTVVAQISEGQETIVTKALPEGTYFIRVDRDDEVEDTDHYIDRLAKVIWN